MHGSACLPLIVLTGACATAPRANLTGHTLYTVEGEPFSFGQHAGKVLVVTYLATWSLPSLAEVQHLISLQQRLAGQGLQVVAVGMDTQGAVVLSPFRDLYQLPFPLLVADSTTLQGQTPFGTLVALPTTYLVDRQNRVQTILGRFDEKRFDAEVEKALAAR